MNNNKLKYNNISNEFKERSDLFDKNKEISRYIVRNIRKEYLTVPDHIFKELITKNLNYETWLVDENKLEEDCKNYLTKGEESK